MPAVAIPNRSVFKAQDVCELLEVQPYVLRSWEAEFPDLGVSKGADGPRLYRRADVEVVVKLRDLLFVEGLTLAGARRRLIEEGATSAQPEVETITDEDVAAVVDKQTLKGLRDVREGLGWILGVLEGEEAGGRRRSAKTLRLEKRKGAKPARLAKAAKRGKAARSTKPSKPARRAAAKGRKKR